jgi:predicted metal-dependent phosphoesterase TrpH
MSKQQTAVEWLIEEIHKNMGVWIPTHIQEQAKSMEKGQIIDAYENGVSDENESNLSGLFTNAEQYYNQTYKK